MSKEIGQTLGRESHTFVLGKAQTSWETLNMNAHVTFISERLF
jgi:hypothetical protein